MYLFMWQSWNCWSLLVELFFVHWVESLVILFDTVDQLLPKFRQYSNKKKIDILLFGINLDIDEVDSRNVKIAKAVQKFIVDTKRFN